MSAHVIRYLYPGTSNGEPVGVVYVRRLADDIPRYPSDVFSYTKNPENATTWPTLDAAERESGRRHWPQAATVPVDEAKPL